MNEIEKANSELQSIRDDRNSIERNMNELKAKRGLKGVDHNKLNADIDELQAEFQTFDNRIRKASNVIRHAEQQAKDNDRRNAILASKEQQLKQQLRANYPGSSEQFDKHWPSIRDDYYAKLATSAIDTPLVRELKSSGIYQNFM